jgi:hypothetical protein|tara:strand:+ start:7332 stop:7517 length:186 start_codon:yes stop_codon:yes gene_type:complete
MSETKNYIEATPEQQQEWFEQDFFMKGDFDVMKLFVVVPAVIQIIVFGMMLAVMYLNTFLF